MKTEKEEILEKTTREYFNSGEDELKKERYNSAVVLFFKALVALVDLYILQNTGSTPSSHGERFRIIQEKHLEIYNLLDKDFPFCQEPSSEECLVLEHTQELHLRKLPEIVCEQTNVILDVSG